MTVAWMLQLGSRSIGSLCSSGMSEEGLYSLFGSRGAVWRVGVVYVGVGVF